MDKYDVVKRDPEVSLTLRELRTKHNLKPKDMAERLGMPIKEYIRAENGSPPLWMRRAVSFFEACFDLGYLPENISLPPALRTAEKSTEYKA